jgi:hypothetical protein
MKKTMFLILAEATKRQLPFLLVGGNAVIMFGSLRNTTDIDLLVPDSSRSHWLDLMRDLSFRFFHGTHSFAQFEPTEAGFVAVDLMFVDQDTWQQLLDSSVEHRIGDIPVRLPKPENLIAMKLHAASSPTRGKPEVDWEDIREIFRGCKIDPADPKVREMVSRYGGEEALRRIDSFPR